VRHHPRVKKRQSTTVLCDLGPTLPKQASFQDGLRRAKMLASTNSVFVDTRQKNLRGPVFKHRVVPPWRGLKAYVRVFCIQRHFGKYAILGYPDCVACFCEKPRTDYRDVVYRIYLPRFDVVLVIIVHGCLLLVAYTRT